MSSSIINFSPWRNRSSSLSSDSSRHNMPQHINDDALDVGSHDDSAHRLSASMGSSKVYREPLRSYIHASIRAQDLGTWFDYMHACTYHMSCILTLEIAPVDSELNARTVRQDTAELASYLLSDGTSPRHASFLHRRRPSVHELFNSTHPGADRPDDCNAAQTIFEVSEPASPDENNEEAVVETIGPSVLSHLLRNSPPQSVRPDAPPSVEEHAAAEPKPRQQSSEYERPQPRRPSEPLHAPSTEQTPLLSHVADEHDDMGDIERQKTKPAKGWCRGFLKRGQLGDGHVAHAVKVAVNPQRWNRKALWGTLVVEPASCMPAVAVGLLLNILDALSYGRIYHIPLVTFVF